MREVSKVGQGKKETTGAKEKARLFTFNGNISSKIGIDLFNFYWDRIDRQESVLSGVKIGNLSQINCKGTYAY